MGNIRIFSGAMTVTKLGYFVAAVISIVLFFNDIGAGQAATSAPRSILARMINQYENTSSYRDSGLVRVLPSDPLLTARSGSPRFQDVLFLDDELVSFKIYYACPRLFRFEWNSSLLQTSRDAVIWSDGKETYSWKPNIFPRNGGFALSKAGTLKFNVEEAISSSNAAIFTVPSLLMKDLTYYSFADMVNSMTDLSLLREEYFDVELCYVIRGRMSSIPWMLWVGKESHLLRKIRTLYTGKDSFHQKGINETLMAEEIHRDIRINERIPNDIFRYKPQLQTQDIDLTR